MSRWRVSNLAATDPVVVSRSTWWLLTGFALTTTASLLPALAHVDSRPAWLRVTAAVALALTALGWLAESRDYRSRWQVVLLEAVTICVVAVSLEVPDAAKTMLFPTLSRRGVSAGTRLAVVAAVLANSLAFGAAVVIVDVVLADTQVPFIQTFGAAPSMIVTPLAMRMLVEGLSARAKAERRAASTSAALGAIVEASPVGLLMVDPDGKVQLCNRTAELILGYPPDDLVGRQISTVTSADDEHCMLLPPATLDGDPVVEREVLGWGRGDGSHVDLTVSTAAVADGSGVVAVVSDVTERRRMQEQLCQQALHDGLTGLANRTLFLDHTRRALTGAAIDGESTAVVLLDLDAFKTVNDTLGHAIGDALLVRVAERLRGCLRSGEVLARLGGDEFAVLMLASGEAEAVVTAQRILSAFDRPIRLTAIDDETATAEVRVRVSLGIVVVTEPITADASALLRAADLAMYAAKRAGGHRWARYEPAMSEQLRERVALENALRQAVAAGDLFLRYQPCIDLRTGEIDAAEALLRWTDPERGAVSPRKFVPIAEDVGMIVPLGRWVLGEACLQAGVWRQRTGRTTAIAVNVSVRQLDDPDLLDDIVAALAAADLPPECLVLELTESELADHSVLPTLKGLKRLGVQLALDDFGTGYSALAYLRRFPLDILKIDRAFVAPITHDPSAAALTKSIIEMAHTLGLRTVAEGVETAEQAQLLHQMGCDLAQGFHFAQPQPAEAVTAALGNHTPKASRPRTEPWQQESAEV